MIYKVPLFRNRLFKKTYKIFKNTKIFTRFYRNTNIYLKTKLNQNLKSKELVVIAVLRGRAFSIKK